MEVLMKNKYQKPAIYLTPEHTEGIYLASGAAGAAGQCQHDNNDAIYNFSPHKNSL